MSKRDDVTRSCRAGTPLPAESAAGGLAIPFRGRRHLRRLDRVFDDLPGPIFFITCCVRNREPLLDSPQVSAVLVSAWETSPNVYRWIVGRYVVMPDHVHFFAAPCSEEARSLSAFVASWKRWTKRGILGLGLARFEWQAEFFDHVLRSSESYESKWEYVRANPVRARLVSKPEDWPFQGEANVLEW